MKRAVWTKYLGTTMVLATLVVSGTAVLVYILLNQRAPNPFSDTYDVSVELSAADGVAPGSGQPVKISGVPVGVISGLELEDGRAVVTLTLDRTQVPVVHKDASATLRPISPLKDLEMLLDRGTPESGDIREGGRIRLAQTTSPIDLDELLSALDGDTRAYLSTLINSVGAGTARGGPDLRKALQALGPAAEQASELAAALDARRRETARLVTNLGAVTRAAATPKRMTEMVQSGNAVLRSVAAEDRALGAAIAELPRTLTAVQRLEPSIVRLTAQLVPTLQRLTPTVGKLAPALEQFGGFSSRTATALEKDVRPFAGEASPVLKDLAIGVQDLRAATPALDAVARTAVYVLNELLYNPPGSDEGLVFWISWFGHNFLSATSQADAHGAQIRAMFFGGCEIPAGLPVLGPVVSTALNLTGACKALETG